MVIDDFDMTLDDDGVKPGDSTTATLKALEPTYQDIPLGFTAEDLADESEDDRLREDKDAAELVDLWASLPPSKRAILLSSEALAIEGRSTILLERFIDEKRVPNTMHLRWINPGLGLGWRGYRPVKRTSVTQKWVPNCVSYGSSTVFVSGGATLCYIPKREWLARQAAEYQAVNRTRFEKIEEGLRGVLEKLARKGKGRLAPELARQLDAMDRGGLALSKVHDPDGPRDTVRAEDLAE